jgi:hypothetical protein
VVAGRGGGWYPRGEAGGRVVPSRAASRVLAWAGRLAEIVAEGGCCMVVVRRGSYKRRAAGLAEELATLRRERDEARRRVASLSQVVELVGGELALEPLLTRIVEIAIDLIGARAGSIGLVKEQGGSPVVHTVAGVGLPARERGMVYPLGVGLSGAVLQARVPLHVERYGDLDRPVVQEVVDYTALGIPIWWAQRIVGVFCVGAPLPHRFDEQHVETLTLFARDTAIVIENARLFGGLQDALTTAQLLYQTSQRMAVAMTVQEVIAAYLEQVAAGGRYQCSVRLDEFDAQGRRSGSIVHGRWIAGEGMVLGEQRLPYVLSELDAAAAVRAVGARRRAGRRAGGDGARLPHGPAPVAGGAATAGERGAARVRDHPAHRAGAAHRAGEPERVGGTRLGSGGAAAIPGHGRPAGRRDRQPAATPAGGRAGAAARGAGGAPAAGAGAARLGDADAIQHEPAGAGGAAAVGDRPAGGARAPGADPRADARGAGRDARPAGRAAAGGRAAARPGARAALPRRRLRAPHGHCGGAGRAGRRQPARPRGLRAVAHRAGGADERGSARAGAARQPGAGGRAAHTAGGGGRWARLRGRGGGLHLPGAGLDARARRRHRRPPGGALRAGRGDAGGAGVARGRRRQRRRGWPRSVS